MKNTVELLGWYGGDEVHALSAWTSTSRDLPDEKRERIPKMLHDLANQGHHTPFEKSSLHFLVTCDQASHIHLLKHRIGVSINAESARYKELKEDKYYLPEDWGLHTETNVEVLNKYDAYDWLTLLEQKTEEMNYLYHQCLKDLTPILGRKRAKESARFFKTFNSQISMDILFNFRSFAHFQKLRNSEHAQVEIREIAQTMADLVRNIEGNPFKHTLEAFNI